MQQHAFAPAGLGRRYVTFQPGLMSHSGKLWQLAMQPGWSFSTRVECVQVSDHEQFSINFAFKLET
jgi:hypothetical protein